MDHKHSLKITIPDVPTSSDGYVTIAGYGSLLSEASARMSCPSLRNFRVGTVNGYVRIFNLVSVHCTFTQHGWATKEVASVVTRPRDCTVLVCSLFEIPTNELVAYCDREYKYQYDIVYAHDMRTPDVDIPTLMCTEFNQDGFEARYGGKEVYEKSLDRN